MPNISKHLKSADALIKVSSNCYLKNLSVLWKEDNPLLWNHFGQEIRFDAHRNANFLRKQWWQINSMSDRDRECERAREKEFFKVENTLHICPVNVFSILIRVNSAWSSWFDTNDDQGDLSWFIIVTYILMINHCWK